MSDVYTGGSAAEMPLSRPFDAATKTMNCINLKERFGDRHPVKHEESYVADRGDGARAEDPWLMIIPCKHGHLYPHDGDLLGASTDRRGPIARSLTEGCRS